MPKQHKVMKSKKEIQNVRVIDNSTQVPDGTTFSLETPFPASQLTKPGRSRSIFSVRQNLTIEDFFSTSISTPTFTSATIFLNQVDQYASFVVVFDQYRITDVEVWLIPQVSADASVRQGELFTVLDFDDANNLTTIAQAQDYETCVSTPQSYGHYRHFKPHVASALYAPSAFTSFGNMTDVWIDSGSSNVAHFGVKVAASISSTALQTYDLNIRMKIQFRNVR
jgi:hypothetical protein